MVSELFLKLMDKVMTKKNLRLVQPNIKIGDACYLYYCQNCGEVFSNDKMPTNGICPLCGFDHNKLEEYPSIIKEDYKEELWRIFASNSNVISLYINTNDFWSWGCACSDEIDSQFFPLLLDLYRKFGQGGIYALICWLNGILPMPEVIKDDKSIINALLYLRRISGFTFHPYYKNNHLTKRLFYSSLKNYTFLQDDLSFAVKEGWISEANVQQINNAVNTYKNTIDDIIKVNEERNGRCSD